MTGRHPFRHGANDVRADAVKLPLSEQTVAEIIKAGSDQHYETATFGKWHLADDLNGAERNPNLQGFDHFEGTPRQRHTYRYFDYDWYVNGEYAGRQTEYRTTFIADRVIDYFRKRSEHAPQFAIVSFTSPHKPYHAPPSSLHSLGDLPDINLRGTTSDTPGPGEYRVNRREPRFDARYHAMLEALDREVERLVSTLEMQSDRPIVFLFLADNGSAGEVYDVSGGSNIRSKATLYDGGVRVPLVIWSSQYASGVLATGRSDQLIHLADLFPTLAELAGVPPREIGTSGNTIDGLSFAASLEPAARQDRAGREFVFLERGNSERLPFAFGAVDQRGLKLILREPARQNNFSAGLLVEIYDTERDPTESENLANQPCAAPAERVSALFQFIVSNVSENSENTEWFNADLFQAELDTTLSDCEPI